MNTLRATVKKDHSEVEEADVLTRQQVNQCIMEIQD